MILRCLSAVALLAAMSACGPPKSVDAAEVVRDLPKYLGKTVVMRARFRSGARCRQEVPGQEDKKGEGHTWLAYCGDCQVCRGPLVLDTGVELPEGVTDWPMILGGTYEGRDIRCKGKLNEVECYPFTLGKTYVVQGTIEAQRPPKLLVSRFWEVEG